MALPPTRLRLAVLIDADNVAGALSDMLFAKISELGEPTIRRAYGALAGQDRGGWHQAMLDHAITPLPQLNIATKKNGADIALVVDAMDILHDQSVDAFCIVSSDRDFSRLATRIRDRGKLAYGFGDSRIDSKTKLSFSAFFDLEAVRVDARLVLIERLYAELARGKDRVLLSALGKALKAAQPPFTYGKLSKLLDELGLFERDQTHVSIRPHSATSSPARLNAR